jgi:hypothetical protein
MARRSGLVVAFVVLIALAGGSFSPPRSDAAVGGCTSIAQVEPALAELMVSQGVGGARTGSYALLTRGKETLVKAFLTTQTGCTIKTTDYVKITNATLTVSSGANPNLLFSNFATPPSLAPTIQSDSTADPIFVVPSANLTPLPLDATFTPTFTLTVTFNRKLGTATQNGQTKTFTYNGTTFERQTNALRIYVVPMGDASQPYSTQFTALDQTIVQNATQTLSRIYPTPSGVADLTAATGGLRYVVDTATMVDLRSISGAYTTIGGFTRFCGTSVNFSAIKGVLAQFLLTHNNANPGATADRVVGVVGGNTSTGSRISFGTEDGAGCADGMASVSSAESWVRLTPDPSRTGALMAMEVAHTFSLENNPSYHSSQVEADAGSDRAYNVVGRNRIAADHSVMNFNNTGSTWGNDNTLLEASDFASLLCKLKPTSAATTACSTPGNIGTATGVAAGEKFIIAGTTDGTIANTKVVEPYYALTTTCPPPLSGTCSVAETPAQDDSLLRLVQLDRSTSPPTSLANFGVPWSPAVTHEQGIASSVQTFYAAAPGGFSGLGTGEVRLVKVASAGDDPRAEVNGSATTLYSTLKKDAPVITSFGVTTIPTSGGSTTITRNQITPRIPPKPDIVILADTTGSMGPALQNVRDNVKMIVDEVKKAQTDAQFAAASYKDTPDFCASDPYVFRIEQALTGDPDVLKAAITPNPDVANSGWQTAPGQGCDRPEAQLNALYELATSTGIGYRSGSTRVIAWFGDAPGHDPSNGHTEADVISALSDGGFRVVAVNMSAEGSSLDADGQATRIANATGGVVKNTTAASEVANAILAGLRDLPATVTPAIDVDRCSPQLSAEGVITFDPTTATVPSGTTVTFTERITLPSGTAAGTYSCRIRFLINGRIVGDSLDPAFLQTISITVADTPKQEVTTTATSADPGTLVLDLIYQCNSFNFVAAVAVPPSAFTTTQATFTTNADTTNACARFGGGGTLVPFVSDGWNRVGGTTTATKSSDPKNPTAAIYSPAVGTSIAWNGTLPLRGTCEVAGVESPDCTLSWAIRAPNGTTTTVGGGTSRDVPAPMPNGWTQGVWTAILTVTYEGRSAQATRTFGTQYQFIGFLSPVDNPPLVNSGSAGKTFAMKWMLKSGATTISSLATVQATQFARATECVASPALAFANTSGQSTLRFDQANMQFVFNWQTPAQKGLYVFRLTLTDGSTHDACVQLS